VLIFITFEGIFLDCDNGTLAFYKNKVPQAIVKANSLKSKTIFPAIGLYCNEHIMKIVTNAKQPSQIPDPQLAEGIYEGTHLQGKLVARTRVEF
jgi:hypothetical protein